MRTHKLRRKLASYALVLSGVVSLALSLSLFFYQAGNSFLGPPPRQALGADSTQFSLTTEAELEAIYQQAWLLAGESLAQGQRPFDWNSWQYRFAGQMRTHRQLSEALTELIGSLGNPDCHYYSQSQWRAHQLEVNGQPMVGVSLSGADPSGAKINSCWRGSPAQKAGLRWGDVLLTVDGIDVSQMEPDQVTAILNDGEEGSTVHLTISRQGQQIKVTLKRAGEKTFEKDLEFNEFLLRREKITTLTVPGLRNDDAAETLAAKINELTKTFPELRGLVLDLRGKQGGSAENLSRLAALFLEKGVICRSTRMEKGEEVTVVYQIKDGKLVESTTAGKGKPSEKVIDTPVNLFKGHLVLVVDKDTAGAAELLTAALKDNGRATVYGAPTCGKGTGQSLFFLPGGHVLKLPATGYFTAGGRALDKAPIQPDVRPADGAAIDPAGAVNWLKEKYPLPEQKPDGKKAPENQPSAGADRKDSQADPECDD